MLSVCGSPQEVHFEPVVVTNLRATWLGGSLCFLNNVTAVVSGADFSYNQASFIGVRDVQVTFVNSMSRHNLGTAASHILGVGAEGTARVAITGCTFVNNTQNVSGGSVIEAYDNATLNITNSTFLQNVAMCSAKVRCGGGGILIQGAAKGEPVVACRAIVACIGLLMLLHEQLRAVVTLPGLIGLV
jgi:hypothetical protein